jgi:hypothetical protein
MRGHELIEELKRKHSLQKDSEVADHLGMTTFQLTNWRKRQTHLTPRQVANAIEKSSKVAVAKSQSHQIRPLVEFFPITVTESKQGAKFALFPAGKEDNPLHRGLREHLAQSNGIYVFYDTRGQAIYAGKAKEQSLWNEMNSAFNRDRDTQTVYRVGHPQRRQKFTPTHESPRRLHRQTVKLHDMAAYFSAYIVDKDMIDDLEALLVRAFANDLLNARMEQFASVRKAAHAKTRKTRKTTDE